MESGVRQTAQRCGFCTLLVRYPEFTLRLMEFLRPRKHLTDDASFLSAISARKPFACNHEVRSMLPFELRKAKTGWLNRVSSCVLAHYQFESTFRKLSRVLSLARQGRPLLPRPLRCKRFRLSFPPLFLQNMIMQVFITG